MSATPAYASSAVVHWFRRDLRLHDNLSLNNALRASASTKLRFLPIFIFDSTAHTAVHCGVNRARFLRESVQSLRTRVQKSLGTDLLVLTGRPVELLPALLVRERVSQLHFEIDPAPPSVAADVAVAEAVARHDVAVHRWHGYMLYDPQRVLDAAAGGKAPRSMSAFLGTVERAGWPDRPVPLDAARGAPHGLQCGPLPSLADLGFPDADEAKRGLFPGGEEAGLRRMLEFLAREDGRVAAQFSKPDTSPATFGERRETTVLSPYLSHGCLSSRMFHDKLRIVENRYKTAAMPQTRLRGQLLWREHFWLLASTVPDFHNERNELCRRIPWDRSEAADERLTAWEEARTGYPWIDALMTQLREEGFVHHLGRHSLACFLTRGDFWVSWVKGARKFEFDLLDYDYALNSANWMWLSCSAFFNSYFRVYSPVAFAKKWDKDGEFVRKYLPVLKNMPTQYVHEPWKAPRLVQVAAKCVVGKDYPERIVDHAVVSKKNIGKMKAAFQAARSVASGESSRGSVLGRRSRAKRDDDDGDDERKRQRR